MSTWKRRTTVLSRWLHIYGSMISFALVFFFSATGLTLNHPDWFAGQERVAEYAGQMEPSWLSGGNESVARLEVVEYLRSTHQVSGAVSDFRIDDFGADVTFKGPGYSADAIIDRGTGAYTLTETRFGFIAVMNDLHKGRDSGVVWKAIIDVSAALLLFVSFSGLALLYFLKKYRSAGVVLLVTGGIVSYLIVAIWVP